MIRANARSRLRPVDIQLALIVLSRGDSTRRRELEARLMCEGPGVLLDHADLADRLLSVRSLLLPSAPLFVYALVRHALLDAGIGDEEVADYLAALLLDFGQRRRATRIDDHDDATHEYLVDLLADLARTEGDRRFQVMAHLGNYALWLAGVFPDRIAAQRVRRGGPDVTYYDALGRRGFAMASEHELAMRAGLDGVYATAAERFPALREALNRMSEQIFFPLR